MPANESFEMTKIMRRICLGCVYTSDFKKSYFVILSLAALWHSSKWQLQEWQSRIIILQNDFQSNCILLHNVHNDIQHNDIQQIDILHNDKH